MENPDTPIAWDCKFHAAVVNKRGIMAAPPPLRGGGVALQGGSTVHVGMPPKVSLSLFPRCLSGWADANGISPKAGGWQ